MDFSADTDLDLIREGIGAICTKFDDDYWAERDRRHEFPWDFYRALADGGWIGIAIPEAYGGSGRGYWRPRSSCRRSPLPALR